MTAKTILVTGSTDGIGRQTVLDLAGKGHRVIIHGRDEERVRETVEAVKTVSVHAAAGSFVADFSSLNNVEEMAGKIISAFQSIDVIVNNAGLYEHEFVLSPDGFEMTFAVNYLAHFCLTLRLLEIIKKSGKGRVVNVASMAHASSMDFDALTRDDHYSAYEAYRRSKLANILFTYELSDRLKGSGITANCLHPGVIGTKLLRAAWSGGAPLETGSRNVMFAALSTTLEGISGRYLVDMSSATSSYGSYDKVAKKRLWELSEQVCGIHWYDVMP